jgi:hypothetical protein
MRESAEAMKIYQSNRHYSGTRQLVRPEVFEKLANFQAYYSKEL